MEPAPRKKTRKGKMIALGGLTVAGLLALLFRCGDFGFGSGGFGWDGRDSGKSEKSQKSERAKPCELRLDAGGLRRDGKPIALSEAVDACRAAGRAHLIVTGDAKFGELEHAREAFKKANVELFTRYPDE
jgi:hypothetical protein